MTKIIPTLFALDKITFDEKTKVLAQFAENLQIDLMDGIYTKNKSVDIKEIEIIKSYPQVEFEAHLMMKNPIFYLEILKDYKIKKVLIHYEAFPTKQDLINEIRQFKQNGMECFLTIEPTTKIEEIFDLVEEIDGLMFMGVISGAEGQSFHENVLDNIKLIREKFPDLELEIDGGIGYKNVKKISELGVKNICIGSYISGNLEIAKQRFEEINNLI